VKKWAYKHFRTEESYEAEVSERERWGCLPLGLSLLMARRQFAEALVEATTAQNDQAAVQQSLNEAHNKVSAV
jgi:hypothetical protein